MRRFATAALLVGVAVIVPGCVVSLGSTVDDSTDRRLDRLESRVEAAEKQLGITQEAP